MTTTSGFTDSRELLGDAEALRRRAATDGFLFIKGLLPRAVVLQLRQEVLAVCARFGWMRNDTPISEGRCNLSAVGTLPAAAVSGGIPPAAYADVQRLERFHTIAHHPNILAFYRELFGTEVFPHPRNIARVMLPHPGVKPTPPHQDYIHIQGTPNTWTLWFPLGDCPRELGGLAMLQGSHKDGLLTVMQAQGAGGLEVHLCNTGRTWIEGDYEAGDVMTFPSYTVHKSLPNQLGDRIRLSCDFRYQPAREPIEEKSLLPHGDILSWAEIYQGWQSGTFQYYWKKYALKMAPWDASLLWQKERICN